MRAKRLVIRGRVQGVGFRDWLVARALSHGLAGWVRNRGDGAVEALIHGEAAAMEEVLRACRRGPPMAAVSQIEEEWADAPGEPGFTRRA